MVRRALSMKLRAALLLLAVIGPASAAYAQSTTWPQKPVRVIVPFPPGGSPDVIARLLGPPLSQEFGQQFVVDNRAGAGGTIGAEIAVRANPDGYTVALVPSTYAASAALYKLPYDPIKAIAPIAMIAAGPNVLVAHPGLKATNLKEFIELARAKPGALNFGSSGVGSTPHLSVELLRQMTNTQMVHVPYKGAGPAVSDVIGGQIQFMIASGPALIPHVRSGRLRALGVTTEQRSSVMPDVPAIAEVIPGYAVSGWNAMWAPAGTPKEIVSRLNQSLARILKQPDVQERLRADGREAAHSTPEELTRVIARDTATWLKVVRNGNIKLD
jgi:tripartite-type tricarboxylate transporter receptor subunit TctC